MELSSTLDDILRNGGLDELQADPGKFGDLHGELRHLSSTNLYFLCKAILGYDKLVPHLHYPMCKFVESPPSRFDLMLAFRGSFKSTIATVGRTVQKMLQPKPNHVLIFSEAVFMAESWSREARQPFEGTNALMNWLWPELQGGSKSSAKWGDAEWHLPGGRKVHAAGLDSSTMGIHVNVLVMDDVFSDPRGDKTTDYADRILQFIKMSLPLVKNPAEDERHLIGVRWWLDGEPYAYFHKNLPSEHRFFLPLLDSDDTCVWPERFPPEEIDQLRADPFVFASQYLLNPVSQDTAIFKRGTLHFFDEKPPERNYTKVMAYDPAYSKDRRSDSNALVVASVDAKGGIWIEHAEKRKLDGHEAKRWAVQQALVHKPMFFGIEANGPQILFFEDVKRELQKYPISHSARKIVLVPLKPHKDKVARWNQLASGCSTGQVRIKKDLTGLISEMYRVTGSKHESNDTVDAAAHLVGPELSKKKPMKLTDVSEQAWLPHALQDLDLNPPAKDWRAM